MARIELDIFSGLPNPVWDLNTTETASLIRQIKNDQTEVRPLSESSDRLGYKGFIIHMDSQESYRSGLGANPVAFRLGEGHANPDTLQELLLRGAQRAEINALAVDAAALAIEGSAEPASSTTDPDTPDTGSETLAGCGYHLTSSVDFKFWGGVHTSKNNCYNYAANWRTGTFAHPGRASGKHFRFTDFWGRTRTLSQQKQALRESMMADGWKTTCSSRSLYVAAAIWPGVDYHFWRRTAPHKWISVSKPWSHKRGGYYPQNTDSGGNHISSPYHSKRWDCTLWCGTMYSPRPSSSSEPRRFHALGHHES